MSEVRNLASENGESNVGSGRLETSPAKTGKFNVMKLASEKTRRGCNADRANVNSPKTNFAAYGQNLGVYAAKPRLPGL